MNTLTAYILRRLGQFVFVIFTGVTLAFLITNLSPVDPVEQSLTQLTSFGASDPRAVELMRESLAELYGLQGNLFEQYVNFWGRVLRADFGPSLSAFPTPVITLIANAAPWTIGLLVTSILITFVLGNLIGALAGYFRRSRFLKVLGMVIMTINPIPHYFIGLILLIFLGFVFPIFPISGGAQMNRPSGFDLGYVLSVLYHGFLPALSLVLAGLGGWFIGMRSLVSNVVTDDHVLYAELAGVKGRKIFSQYVARNAMLPQMTGLAMQLGQIFGGTVIVEFLFNYPGMGRLLIQGIYRGDYSLVLGVTTISIFAVAFAVLLIDILYPLIDPRVKLG
ncbi:ABC transporter permease [Wenxinia saemankumensis]|uniref:Peptide/nickel transport system permease protein n=1 Tax=Wenxinia saemankumensis TaxID=1447782 RepID=A0A1M6HSS7_9RHOB|nr:ABC transporter permease [Wenxinia saemankumensis]SHJ25187.1 peptide/nickel transport system permease protein [Wenxinia saemankumensis]